MVLTDFTPENFGTHVQKVLNIVENKPEEHKIVFIKSWNEWAEGNYLEPDMKWGLKFLEVLKEKIKI